MTRVDETINAIKMVRRIREARYTALLGKSPSERIAFYREKARALLEQTPSEQVRQPAERKPA